MSSPSDWPLPPESIRFVIPRRVIGELSLHPLSQGLYPLGMGYYRKASGHRMARREHDDYLLIYCLDGEGAAVINEHKIRIRAGDILLIPKGISHTYQARKSKPWTIYWVHFHGHHAEDFITHLQQKESNLRRYVMPIGIHSRLASDFEALLEARESTYNLNAYICAANQLRQILSHIALLQPLAKQKLSRGGLDIERVHSLMQAHIHEQLDLDTLTASINLSKYHFVKKYKEITGTTPINHFIQLKIERACHLLDTTNNGINEVAFAVGYEDAYYFSRIFKKLMGVSPSQYRKMRTGEFSYSS
ncbi:MAG: AraC family transcriptional regulator [Neptuniibacter caesariensis]|uniref:AraC family transcriptional regulator n=1 Tax=Neptuniibacter caesariensis TaxID=207954 RepID=A0A2G6JDP6_NEPCE|nr:MAG: AraC family transcriptional regulator [Neptuniibacter caesariensis]